MLALPAQERKLAIPALLIWIAAIAALVLAWANYRLHILHPPFLPLVGLFAFQVLAAIALFVFAVPRIVRKANRARAFGWLLLGTAPLGLGLALFGHGAVRLFEQHAALSLPVKVTIPAIASLADLFVRVRHPQRSEGRRTALIHDAPEPSRKLLDTIDRHVEQMEQLLGRSSADKIHWIRGGVFGHAGEPAGWNFWGLSVVTHPTPGVASIDRHEVAHGVIERLAGPDAQPPNLLVEGWAESQSGYDPGFLAQRVLERRRRGQFLTLRQLTEGDMATCVDWPVYEFGGALVEYLLDAFGGPKFLELYTTCRQATFADDCRRVLGVDLDSLDKQYWQFAAGRAQELVPDRVNPLLAVALADGVDRAAWLDFARQYPAATAALSVSADRARLTFHGTFASSREPPRPIRYTIAHDGPRRLLAFAGTKEQYAVVATPAQSFLARRRHASDPWTVDPENQPANAFVHYCARRVEIDFEESGLVLGGYDGIFRHRFVGNVTRPGFRVTRFEALADVGEPAVRLEFEYATSRDRDAWQHRDRLTLLPHRHWVVRAYEGQTTGPDGSSTWRNNFEFADEKLPPAVPSAAHWSVESAKRRVGGDLTLTEFKPLNSDGDADLFALKSFGISPAQLPHRAPHPWFVTLPALAGIASLASGIALLAVANRGPSPLVGEGGSRSDPGEEASRSNTGHAPR